MGWEIYGSRGGVIASTLVVQLISTLCIGLRFYTRFWKRQSVLVSDWLVLGAFVCATGLSVMEIYGVAIKSFAVPLTSTDPTLRSPAARIAAAQHMEYAFVLTGVFSLGLIKLSVCLLYWHIFSRVRFRRFLTVWIAVIVSWTLTFVLGELFECGVHPLKVFGSKKDVAKYCPAIHKIGYALVGSDVGTDLVTLLIPLPLIVSMRLPTTRKILVATTFAVGILAVAASTAKAYIYIAATMALTKEDGIILLTAYSIWNLVEIHVGIIAACGMTLRPIFDRIFPLETILCRIRSLKASLSRSRSGAHDNLPSFVQVGSTTDSCSPRPDYERAKMVTDHQGMTFQTSALPEVR